MNRESSVFKASILTGILVILAVLVGFGFLMDFVIRIGIFVLSIFVGYLIVWNVTPALHTPLMSVTNAISGIIVVGCMLTMIQFSDNEFFSVYSILAFLGLFFASINVVGGFVVTQRMLNMFRK